MRWQVISRKGIPLPAADSPEHTLNRSPLAVALLALLSSSTADAKPNDIDADKSARRAVNDPMDASDCDKIYGASGGKFFPRAKPFSSYKAADCSDPIFWGGELPNANPKSPGFDKLPLCLGMGENISFYLAKYPGKCRRLTVANRAWSQDINQRLLWCAAKGHLKGGVIWLANNEMLSKGWAATKLKKGLEGNTDDLFVTASEACFWHKSMGKPFPLSGKAKAAQAASTKAAAKPAKKAHGTATSAHP